MFISVTAHALQEKREVLLNDFKFILDESYVGVRVDFNICGNTLVLQLSMNLTKYQIVFLCA